MAVNFQGPGEHDSNGDASGAICQKLCTEKGADGFSWSHNTGCWLKAKLGGHFEVQHVAGAYSGFPCEKVATYTPWISMEVLPVELIYRAISSLKRAYLRLVGPRNRPLEPGIRSCSLF